MWYYLLMQPSDARPVEERFWEKVIKTNTCWIWTGGKVAGYGRMWIGSRTDGSRRSIYTHQLSFQLHKGIIPSGMFVLHTCDNPPCVNPEHLYLGDALQNGADMRNRERSPKRKWTHCINGHEFNEKNTKIRPNGTRLCRKCASNRSMDRVRRLKERGLNR